MDDERTLARKLLGIMHRVRHSIDADLRHFDGERRIDPAHFPVLINLRRRAYNVSELAERLEVSLPSMSKTVTALVKRGWVERVRSQEDRRVVQLHRNLDPITLLNVIPPLWPGFIVDAVTGAITRYDPEVVSVDFRMGQANHDTHLTSQRR